MTVRKTLAFVHPALLAVAFVASWAPAAQGQLYGSSVVGTEFDCLRDDDPTTFQCLHATGRGQHEMPDKSADRPLMQEAFAFQAHFSDGTSVNFAVDADFQTEAAAGAEALRYTSRLGKLPTALRRGVNRIVVHAGGEDTTAFSDSGLIVVYADNATQRISTHDLEETLFHESVHAAWDTAHAASPAWREAQASDGVFVTRYGSEHPDREDLAESALLAYTLLHHPDRLPDDDRAKIAAAIPARVAFVKTLLPPGEPLVETVGPRHECDGTELQSESGPPKGTTERRPESEPEAEVPCKVDLDDLGVLHDVISNALTVGLGQDEGGVQTFLSENRSLCDTPELLRMAVAAAFDIDRATLDAKVEEFRHCNCTHPEQVEASQPR